MKKFLLLVAAMLVAGVSVQAQEVTPPAKAQIEVYNCTGYSYSLYEELEWEALVATSGNQMYIKNLFPNMQNIKWVVGTISNGKVVFTGGQVMGDQDQTLIGGDMKFEDCKLYGASEDMEPIDASLSWDETTKTLKALDYEIASWVDWEDEQGGWVLAMLDAYDGYSDPDAAFTMVGTGEIVDPVTAINDIKVEASKAYKTIENGQVVIVKDNARYNVAGQMIK
ncbi:MAG: hypothetical protein KBT13_02795 [Bacteroidales bacterium]|nr:hypothetical protein [Candidatus Sodaliphilus limicaballi]